MKKIIIGLLAIISSSAFALPSDCSCKLIDRKTDSTIAKVVAQTGQGISIKTVSRGNEIFELSANNFNGYKLVVNVYNAGSAVLVSEIALNVDSNESPNASTFNPKKVSATNANKFIEVKCTRADEL